MISGKRKWFLRTLEAVKSFSSGRISRSSYTQYIRLAARQPERLVFDTETDLEGTPSFMEKTAFPVDVYTGKEAASMIQFGYVERPAASFQSLLVRRIVFGVCNHRYSAAATPLMAQLCLNVI